MGTQMTNQFLNRPPSQLNMKKILLLLIYVLLFSTAFAFKNDELVNFNEKTISIQEVLNRINAQNKMNLECDRVLKNQKISLFVKNYPVIKIESYLSELLGSEWVEIDDKKKYHKILLLKKATKNWLIFFDAAYEKSKNYANQIDRSKIEEIIAIRKQEWQNDKYKNSERMQKGLSFFFNLEENQRSQILDFLVSGLRTNSFQWVYLDGQYPIKLKGSDLNQENKVALLEILNKKIETLNKNKVLIENERIHESDLADFDLQIGSSSGLEINVIVSKKKIYITNLLLMGIGRYKNDKIKELQRIYLLEQLKKRDIPKELFINNDGINEYGNCDKRVSLKYIFKIVSKESKYDNLKYEEILQRIHNDYDINIISDYYTNDSRWSLIGARIEDLINSISQKNNCIANIYKDMVILKNLYSPELNYAEPPFPIIEKVIEKKNILGRLGKFDTGFEESCLDFNDLIYLSGLTEAQLFTVFQYNDTILNTNFKEFEWISEVTVHSNLKYATNKIPLLGLLRKIAFLDDKIKQKIFSDGTIKFNSLSQDLKEIIIDVLPEGSAIPNKNISIKKIKEDKKINESVEAWNYELVSENVQGNDILMSFRYLKFITK
jgi:hypothetical protein